MKGISVKEPYDLTKTIAGEYLSGFEYPWEALSGIGDLIMELGPKLDPEVYVSAGDGVWVAKSAKIYPTASITGPCIIGERTEVRPSAFIRGKALVGCDCVVGNSTELKNVILFDNVQVPHYNYVGDSILGYHAHMGAGSITSNVKSDKTNVVIKDRASGDALETGIRKIGAMLGDNVEVGCNTVLNPGTVVGRDSVIYPTSCVRGVIPSEHIFKNPQEIVAKK